MKKAFTLSIIINLFFEVAYSAILSVPAQYTTIQAAILATGYGDTVVVSPGTYFENINFRGHNIVLTSLFYLNNDTSYILNTIIDGSQPLNADTATCIILNTNEDSTTIIQGFSITGGAGTKWFDVHGAGTFREGGAIITEYSSPIIRYNFIHNNFVNNKTGVSSTGGGGIRCGDGHPTIVSNVICNNQAYGYGGAIVSNFSRLTIQNNLIANNSGGYVYGGGGIWVNGNNLNLKVNIINNTIVNNHAYGSGSYGGKAGAILNFSIRAILNNNILWGNTQTAGAEIAGFNGGQFTVSYTDAQTLLVGAGNISVYPLFADSTKYFLTVFSPCIDAGDTAIAFNDNVTTPGMAAFPSLGTERNDMGCYGGFYAITIPACENSSYGFNEIKADIFYQLFPVPANSQMTIHIDDILNHEIYLEIFASNGQNILRRNITENDIKLNVESYKNGLYMMHLYSSEKDYGINRFEITH